MMAPPASAPWPTRLLARLRRAFPSTGAALLVLSVCLIAGLAILASELREAPFRLNIKTSSIWFIVDGSDMKLEFDAGSWQLNQPYAVALSEPGALAAHPRSIAAVPDAAPSSIVLYPEAGAHLSLALAPGAAPQLRIQALVHPLLAQVKNVGGNGDGGLVLVATLTDGREVRAQTTFIEATLASLILQPLPSGTTSTSPVTVRQLGFGTKNERNALRTGVTGGELYFLDTPSLEIKIFRGTDLRISGRQLVLDALAVTPDGLEVTVSGLARSAGMHLGSVPENRPHSLMPTYFDRAQRSPLAILGVGALGLLISLAGLWLAMAERFPSNTP